MPEAQEFFRVSESESNAMKKTPFASLFSCLSLVALLLASCGSPTRYLGNGAGSGGEGDVATSGATFTAGDGGTGGKGTMHSAGAGAVSMSGGDAGDSSSGAGGSGASAGAPGTP